MPKPLRGTRYLKPGDEWLATFIQEELPYLDYYETCDWYRENCKRLNAANQALLGCNDRYYLLTGLLHRIDALHPWLFDRCREVEKDPDGHIDLWARFHYKSTLISFAGSIQEIMCDPEITIAIFSVVKPIAAAFLTQIKEEFENNEDLKSIYADVLYANPRGRSSDGRPAKWGAARGITVKRKTNPKEATVEAHGLIDGQPTSRHFRLHIYDDVVTQDYISEDLIRKTTERWEMADNLGSHLGVRKWMPGTRYCTIGSTRILMQDWSHKPIADVRVGDVVVGWELRDGKRYLRPAKVVNRGVHLKQPVNRYVFENGRSVVCTADHKWWRGAHGGGSEYAPLALPLHVRKDRPLKGRKPPNGRLLHVRQLLIPSEPRSSRDAAWLAGFFDGEGTFRKNTNHASGVVCISQTTHNQILIDECRAVLNRLGFRWSEDWVLAEGRSRMTSDRCMFSINGGWRERYRFLAEVAPVRRAKIAASLYAQLMTDRIKLDRVEDVDVTDVHWLETETGNYVAEGFCSSNSFADTYGTILERKSLKSRIYPATDDGTLTGKPVFLSDERWAQIKNDQRSTVSAQMLQNPLAGTEATFRTQWLRQYEVIPAVMNVYVMVDPSKGSGQRSDRTAIAVIGIDQGGNKYLLDGVRHRMKLSDRWAYIKAFRHKWMTHPGVQMVRVGYEQYGMLSDLEVIEDRMREENLHFEIVELNTPRQGGHSKDDRVERMEPDMRAGRVLFPAVVYNADAGGDCYWTVWTEEHEKKAAADGTKHNNHVGQVLYWQWRGLTKRQRAVKPNRVVTALQRRDEAGAAYDVTRAAIDEIRQHPFGTHDDLVDVMSRIYDMDPQAPVAFERQSTEPLGLEGDPADMAVEDER